jgi:hypothetical protein
MRWLALAALAASRGNAAPVETRQPWKLGNRGNAATLL